MSAEKVETWTFSYGSVPISKVRMDTAWRDPVTRKPVAGQRKAATSRCPDCNRARVRVDSGEVCPTGAHGGIFPFNEPARTADQLPLAGLVQDGALPFGEAT